MSSPASGLPTRFERPQITTCLTGGLVARAHEHLLDAVRRARIEGGLAPEQPARVDGMEAVDVLFDGNGARRKRLVDVRGQRQLDEDAVPRRVGVEIADEPQQFVLGDIGRQVERLGPHPDRGCVARLPSHIGHGRRVIADEHDDEAGFDTGRFEAHDIGAHLAANLLRDRIAIDDGCRHARSVQSRCPGTAQCSGAPSIPRGYIGAYNRGMEMAVGIDIIEIERVRKVLERHPERFLRRVYTPEEVAFCRGRVSELAARFSAKEAVMKALGTGARGLAWREIEILPNRRGKPLVYLHGQAKLRAETIGLRGVDVSLTHDADLAIAAVVGMAESAPIDRETHRARLVEWLKEQGRL